MRRRHVTNALLILSAVFVGYLCFLLFAPFLLAIAWAGVLAIIIDPIHRRIRARLPSKSLAAALACSAAVLIVVLPLVGVGIAVTRSLIELSERLPMASGGTSVGDWIAYERDVIAEVLNRRFGISPESLDLSKTVETVSGKAMEQTQRIVGGIPGVVVNITTIVFTLFFFLRDQEEVLDTIRGFIPLSDSSTTAVFHRVRDVIRASVIGGGAVALSQGILAGFGFWALGIPSPLLWGVATLFFSFIPFVGAAGIWVPATIILLVKGSWVKAIILACYGTFIISLVDNVLRPILIGDATQLHTLLIFFSILGGLQLFGFLGLIMGPVVLAVGLALVEIFRREILEDEERRRTGRLDLDSV